MAGNKKRSGSSSSSSSDDNKKKSVKASSTPQQEEGKRKNKLNIFFSQTSRSVKGEQPQPLREALKKKFSKRDLENKANVKTSYTQLNTYYACARVGVYGTAAGLTEDDKKFYIRNVESEGVNKKIEDPIRFNIIQNKLDKEMKRERSPLWKKLEEKLYNRILNQAYVMSDVGEASIHGKMSEEDKKLRLELLKQIEREGKIFDLLHTVVTMSQAAKKEKSAGSSWDRKLDEYLERVKEYQKLYPENLNEEEVQAIKAVIDDARGELTEKTRQEILRNPLEYHKNTEALINSIRSLNRDDGGSSSDDDSEIGEKLPRKPIDLRKSQKIKKIDLEKSMQMEIDDAAVKKPKQTKYKIKASEKHKSHKKSDDDSTTLSRSLSYDASDSSEFKRKQENKGKKWEVVPATDSPSQSQDKEGSPKRVPSFNVPVGEVAIKNETTLENKLTEKLLNIKNSPDKSEKSGERYSSQRIQEKKDKRKSTQLDMSLFDQETGSSTARYDDPTASDDNSLSQQPPSLKRSHAQRKPRTSTQSVPPVARQQPQATSTPSGESSPLQKRPSPPRVPVPALDLSKTASTPAPLASPRQKVTRHNSSLDVFDKSKQPSQQAMKDRMERLRQQSSKRNLSRTMSMSTLPVKQSGHSQQLGKVPKGSVTGSLAGASTASPHASPRKAPPPSPRNTQPSSSNVTPRRMGVPPSPRGMLQSPRLTQSTELPLPRALNRSGERSAQTTPTESPRSAQQASPQRPSPRSVQSSPRRQNPLLGGRPQQQRTVSLWNLKTHAGPQKTASLLSSPSPSQSSQQSPGSGSGRITRQYGDRDKFQKEWRRSRSLSDLLGPQLQHKLPASPPQGRRHHTQHKK